MQQFFILFNKKIKIKKQETRSSTQASKREKKSTKKLLLDTFTKNQMIGIFLVVLSKLFVFL